LAELGWYDGNAGNRSHRVGEKPANPWGLYDVHGNVWEWTLSPWTRSYEGREGGVSIDPTAVEIASGEAPGGGGRVMRGGSFWSDAVGVRAAYRHDGHPGFGDVGRGFRVVLPVGPELLVLGP
jgi:sulfatase modifying factor 1